MEDKYLKKIFSRKLPKTITRQDIEKEDSLAMKARMLNVYLRNKWEKVEQIIGNDYPDDVCLEELVEDLWEDLLVARKQIVMTYGFAAERDFEE